MPLTEKGREIMSNMRSGEGGLPRLQGPPEDPNVMGPSNLTQPSGPKEPVDFAGMCADQNYERDALSPMGKLPTGMSLDAIRGWKP